MATSVQKAVAPWWHTAILMAFFLGTAAGGAALQHHARGHADLVQHRPDVVLLYISLIAGEWGLVYYVWKGGLRPSRITLLEFVGGRWNSAKAVFLDVVLAIGLWSLWQGISFLWTRWVSAGHAASISQMMPHGWVERARLLAIRGRSRSGQLALAKREGVELFGCPSGGCLLTDPVIARRLKDLFRYFPEYDMRDVTLVTFGRHFRLQPDLKVILGRNQAENERLQQIGMKWPRLEIADIPGPVMLVCGTMRDGAKQSLARLLRRFGVAGGTLALPIGYLVEMAWGLLWLDGRTLGIGGSDQHLIADVSPHHGGLVFSPDDGFTATGRERHDPLAERARARLHRRGPRRLG